VDMRKRKELGSLARWDEGKIPRRFFLLEGQEGKGKTPVFPSTHVLGSGTRQGPGAGDLTQMVVLLSVFCSASRGSKSFSYPSLEMDNRLDSHGAAATARRS
jgi:hypothetical protein